MLSLSDCPCCISLRKDLEAPKTKVADYHTLKAKVADYDTIKEQVVILAVEKIKVSLSVKSAEWLKRSCVWKMLVAVLPR